MSAKDGYTREELERLVRLMEPSLDDAEVEKSLERIDSMGVRAFDAWLIGVHYTLIGDTE